MDQFIIILLENIHSLLVESKDIEVINEMTNCLVSLNKCMKIYALERTINIVGIYILLSIISILGIGITIWGVNKYAAQKKTK